MDQYEKLNDGEKLKFLANLANMYYEQNMTQSEIADQLSTTRFKVSRLLQEARDRNVVEIIINQPKERASELEGLLIKHFQLTHAIVLDNNMMSHDETIYSLGKLGAAYVDSIMKENSIVGVLWGKTLFNLIRQIKPKTKLPITAVQVLGSAAKNNPTIDSPELIRKLANSYGGKYKYLYAPLYIDNEYARRALLQEPVINDALFLGSKCDIVLTGIGTVEAVYASTLWSSYLVKNRSLQPNAQRAVGCIYAHLFDIHGEPADNELNHKIIGVDLKTLHQVKYTIGVAAGKYKAEAILGALRGKHINVLITDDSTAQKVLFLAGIPIES